MHIPDGYLSPASCAITLAAVVPFWLIALRRLKQQLHTRMLPLLSLFAAFSFVVMMFNLPLPGGTTGHAVGVAIAAIVLGPWAATLAVSMALLIQAVFFGDGGITALGANCLNIAVVGSFTAHAVYQLIAAGAKPDARRRVVAAALAGYVAINLAALLTAIEFGLQPMFFHDAQGTPLYAPYPLSVAVPAMMIGHLGVAGLAEALLAGGLLAYLQRSQPELLALGAPADAARAVRRLWYGLAALMIASPLGLLAAGTAWGEWGAEDFASAEGRNAILAASQHAPLPEAAPQGLEKLASLWSAPIPDYAPAFLHSEALGYILSAMLGCGLLLLTGLLLSRVMARRSSGA